MREMKAHFFNLFFLVKSGRTAQLVKRWTEKPD